MDLEIDPAGPGWSCAEAAHVQPEAQNLHHSCRLALRCQGSHRFSMSWPGGWFHLPCIVEGNNGRGVATNQKIIAL